MKSKRNIPLFVLFLLMSIFAMVMIFLFSYQGAEISAGVSSSVYDLFIRLTGFDFISHGAFRKIAHFSEFMFFGFSVIGTLYFWLGKLKFPHSFIFCVLYSVSDEIHQYFVPGRACRIFDVFVDSCGSLFGILIFILLIFVINKLKRRCD